MCSEVRFEQAELDRLIGEAAARIAADVPRVQHMIAIERWGIIPAMALQQLLPGCPSVSTVRISFYGGNRRPGRARVHGFEENLPLWRHFAPGEILVVDDVADRGLTLCEFQRHYDGPPYRTFVLFKKPLSPVDPTYVARHLESDAWIVFPWDEA